jgi:hypothetical protein
MGWEIFSARPWAEARVRSTFSFAPEVIVTASSRAFALDSLAAASIVASDAMHFKVSLFKLFLPRIR